MQCDAVCCSVASRAGQQVDILKSRFATKFGIYKRGIERMRCSMCCSVCCSVLQCDAVCYSVASRAGQQVDILKSRFATKFGIYKRGIECMRCSMCCSVCCSVLQFKMSNNVSHCVGMRRGVWGGYDV